MDIKLRIAMRKKFQIIKEFFFNKFFGITEGAVLKPHVKLPFKYPGNYTKNKDLKILNTPERKFFNRFLKYEKRNLVVTHSGLFHCDEVMATILLKYARLIKKRTIIRTRDESFFNESNIVYDVGFKFDPNTFRYDHHMNDFTETFSPNHSIKLSSCGLIYKYHGKAAIKGILSGWGLKDTEHEGTKCEDEIYQNVYDNLIMFIDATDNGIDLFESDTAPLYMLNGDLRTRVARCNLLSDRSKEEKFKTALDICEEELLWQIYNSVVKYYPFNKIKVDKITPEPLLETYNMRYKFHNSGRTIKVGDAASFLPGIEEKHLEAEVLLCIEDCKDDISSESKSVRISIPRDEGRKHRLSLSYKN